MPQNREIRLAALALVALALVGCSDTRRALGVERTAPDEFQVVKRSPLSVPPDFTLRPPVPGASPAGQRSPRERAQDSVLREARGGRSVARERAQGDGSQGERAILGAAGADRAAPDIRTLVDRETAALMRADLTLIERLLFETPPPVDPVVAAGEEKKRLDANKEGGRPLTAGEVPTIERKDRGLLPVFR